MNRANPLRCLAVWLGVTVAVGLGTSALLPLEVALSGTFEELLVRLSTWALLACAGWFWLVTTVVVATALRAPAHAAGRLRGVPAPVRRLLLAACGVAFTIGAASPALATPGPVHVGQQEHSGRVVLTGLPFPDRATVGSSPAKQPSAVVHAPTGQDGGGRRVVVREGDSLWSIAAAHLPADASDAEIATAWHLIYERNRAAVGNDPDMLVPGQHLVLPHILA